MDECDDDWHEHEDEPRSVEEEMLDALDNGDVQAVERLGKAVDWNRMYDDDKTLGQSLAYSFQSSGPDVQAACLMLIDCAVKAGRKDIFKPYESYFYQNNVLVDGHRLEPIEEIIRNGFDRVLLRFLDAGMDPTNPMNGKGRYNDSAIDLADAMGRHEIAAMFRAHVARKTVNASISDMLLDAKKKPVP